MEKNELEDIKKGIEIIGDAHDVQERRINEIAAELMALDLHEVQSRMELAALKLNAFCDEYVQDRDLQPAYRGRSEEDPAGSLMTGVSMIETPSLGDRLELSFTDESGCHENCPAYQTPTWHHGGPNARYRRVTLVMYSANDARWKIFENVETIPHEPLDLFDVDSDAYKDHIREHIAPLIEAAETMDALLGDINDTGGIAIY